MARVAALGKSRKWIRRIFVAGKTEPRMLNHIFKTIMAIITKIRSVFSNDLVMGKHFVARDTIDSRFVLKTHNLFIFVIKSFALMASLAIGTVLIPT